MKLSIVAFEANGEDSIEKQTNCCIDQLMDFVSGESINFSNIIALNFFLLADSNEKYLEQKEIVGGLLPDELSTKIPIAYLAQAPACGKKISVEVHLIPKLKDADIAFKKIDGNAYLSISNKLGEKLVIANGINTSSPKHNILEDSEYVFSIMEQILLAEGLSFSNIFRQWNYIEEITSKEGPDKQHYQQFNNVRSKYYAKADFENGYPAATGIGTVAGGVIVSFYAASPKGLHVISVENPLQRAAFDYTEEVLVGDEDYQGFRKCTPKFARAKFVENAASKQVYISGTASIREERTIAEDDVVEQTIVTIDNIEKLISEETLSAIDQPVEHLPQIEFFRVYIKQPGDFERVKETCELRWPKIPNIYVISDVCRENLLVEIEALASV